jgi:hypothetical protein
VQAVVGVGEAIDARGADGEEEQAGAQLDAGDVASVAASRDVSMVM